MAVIAAGDLPAEDIAAGRRAAAIVAATPEVVRAEALRIRATILRQDKTAGNFSRTGLEAGFHSPSGGFERSLQLFFRMELERKELIPRRSAL